jgi:hypothetical protein
LAPELRAKPLLVQCWPRGLVCDSFEGGNMTAHVAEIAPDLDRSVEGRRTPEQVLKSIVDGINSGNLDSLMSLYEPGAAFATQPGSLSHGLPGVRQALAGFVAMIVMALTGLITIYIKQRGGLHNKKSYKGVFVYRELYVH